MKYDIVCIGMAIMDSIIRGFDPEPVLSGFRAESGSLKAGGDAVNESVAASKLGLRTGILCSLGNDPAGDMIAAELASSGVSTDLIIRSDANQTPVTTIFVMEDGNRRSITNKAHRYNFHPENYMDTFSSRAIILGSLFRAPFNDPGVLRDVLVSAKSQGMLVFADTKLPNFRKLSLDDISDLLPMIDFVTPNLSEAEYYSGRKDPSEMAGVFMEKGARNVIIKLGEQGCFFRNSEMELRIPAYSTDTIDATGAGDNFIAGFASKILGGADIEESLLFASACGAICTTEIGAGTALINSLQVEEFIRQHSPEQ